MINKSPRDDHYILHNLNYFIGIISFHVTFPVIAVSIIAFYFCKH